MLSPELTERNMMRLARVALVLLLLPLQSCAEPALAEVVMMTACSIDDNAPTGSRCANLLPKKWDLEKFDNKDADNLRKFLVELKLMAEEDTKQRVASKACRDNTNIEDKKFRVTLRVPEAIRQLPPTGSRGRSLVSAVFVADADQGCPEALYGHRARNKKDSQDWEIVAQFTTITTTPSGGAGAVKQQIGTWRSYSISQKRISLWRDKFRLNKKIAEGPLMLCQKEVYHTDEVAYISCEQSSALMKAVAEKTIPGINTVDEALRAFKAGRPGVRERVGATGDVSDAPGWMRCGELGCCAMYGM